MPSPGLAKLKPNNLSHVIKIDYNHRKKITDYYKNALLLNKMSWNMRKSYGCTVKSIVTDNAANMRKDLGGKRWKLVAYGCAAHFLNLLAWDVWLKDIIECYSNLQIFQKPSHSWLLVQRGRWKSASICLQKLDRILWVILHSHTYKTCIV